MDLSNLSPAEGSVMSDNFRRGRGHGSGNGKTAGKGHKGQKARSGAPRPGFEGGQMPLYRRIPKRGFTNRNRREFVAINISTLERFDNGAEVTVDTLIESGIVKNPKDGIKILGNGELTKNLDPSMPLFVISHEPDHLSDYNAHGVDIVLSGHTHAGQFFPLTIVQPFVWENHWGMKMIDSMYSFVTSGIGVYGPDMRVGTNSEVMVIDVHFE